jgi:hypothetical protein
MRLTSPQQPVGDGFVTCLIVQRLEAKVTAGALRHKSTGIAPWAFKTTASRIGISFSISIGMASLSFSVLPKLESTSMANLNWH